MKAWAEAGGRDGRAEKAKLLVSMSGGEYGRIPLGAGA